MPRDRLLELIRGHIIYGYVPQLFNNVQLAPLQGQVYPVREERGMLWQLL